MQHTSEGDPLFVLRLKTALVNFSGQEYAVGKKVLFHVVYFMMGIARNPSDHARMEWLISKLVYLHRFISGENT
jgi:hypothetical protein